MEGNHRQVHRRGSIHWIRITAYIVADLLRSKPVYEALLERILHKLSNHALSGNRKHKAIREFAVTMGSAPDSKKVKEIDWPENCLLVAIKRGAREIIPKGNTVLLPGDYLVVLTNEDSAPEISDSFHEILQVPET